MAFRKQYCNLHTHGTYSLLDGHGRYSKYTEKAARLGQPSLAITEHGNVFGLIDFYEACRDSGIKFIAGMEGYQARKTRLDRDDEERAGPASSEFEQRGPYHLTILAKNYTGYKNLIKLSSRAFLEGFYVKPRTDHEIIADHSEGLILLSGCLSGEVQQALLRDNYDGALKHAATMQEIVGKENYFIEIHDHLIEEEHRVKDGLLRIAKELNAPIAPSGDCHYVDKGDSFHHDMLICLNTASRIHQKDRFKFVEEEFFLRSYDEMLDRFENPEWLENTLNISDMVEEYDLDFETKHFPKYQDIPTGKTLSDVFVEKIKAGAYRIYGEDLPQEVKDRLNYEIGVIHRMGYEDYMLIVADLIQWASDNNILTGPGRGSAAGSIIAYCLGITHVDPVKYKLKFERFLVEGKKSSPDIDVDFDTRYRDQVIQYTKEKYGLDRVANIITFSSIGAKSAIRDAARVLGAPYSKGDELATKVLPPEFGKSKSITESLQHAEDFIEAYEDEENKEIIDGALGIEGMVRQEGVNAAGVVITPGPLTDYVPVAKKGDEKPLVTQWDKDTVEKIGLLKMDFLGLRNLDVIDMTLKNIKALKGEELNIYTLPQDDENAFSLITKGETIGVFQLGSTGIQSLARDIKIENMDHLAALIALYRPGPMGSGMHHMFAYRKNGQRDVESYHPLVESILSETYGLMIYQEQTMEIVQTLAEFSIMEADDLRKAISKKKSDDLHKLRDRFISGAKESHNISDYLANKIFDDIEYFGNYSFNRAHSYSYGLITYITAFLKANYPTEYMTAVLSSVLNERDEVKLYLNECKRMGIEVRPPSVKASGEGFTIVKEGTITYGLLGINKIGGSVVKTILKDQDKVQDCQTISEWLMRAPNSVNNKGRLEALVYAGALDDFAEEITNPLTDEAKIDILNKEREQLGIYITGHPLDFESKPIEDIPFEKGKYVDVRGVIVDVKQRTTKAGAVMYNYILDRPVDSIEVVVFPKMVEKINPDLLIEGAIVTVRGRLNIEVADDDSTVKRNLIHMDFVSHSQEHKALDGGDFIEYNLSSPPSEMTMKNIYDIIKYNKGDTSIYLNVSDNDLMMKFRLREKVDKKAASQIQKMLSE